MGTHVAVRRRAVGALFALTLLVGGTAQAARIEGVTASPGSTPPNAPVQVTVLKSGSGSCGALLDFGDGQSRGPFGFNTNPRVFTHPYAQPGTYTITAKPRKKGNLAACKGGPKTATVTVASPGGQGTALEAGPAPSRNLERKPQPMKAGAAPGGALKALPALEKVELECPPSLDYTLPPQPNADPRATGWQRSGPTNRTLRLRFAGMGSMYGSGYSRVRELDCHYETRIENGDDFHVKLSRKVHPSGELYRCRADGRKIDCTLVPEDER